MKNASGCSFELAGLHRRQRALKLDAIHDLVGARGRRREFAERLLARASPASAATCRSYPVPQYTCEPRPRRLPVFRRLCRGDAVRVLHEIIGSCLVLDQRDRESM